MTSPHDLLPIQNPKFENPDKVFFYNNVIKPLIPDIIKMQAEGIPIDLNKVAELEKKVNEVLENVNNTLKNNALMKKYLEATSRKIKKNKKSELEQKKKIAKDFIKPFNYKNKIHRSYVINYYLDYTDKSSMKMNEWSIRDIKKLNQIIASRWISEFLDGLIKEDNYYIIEAMKQLAEDQCRLYNKNHIDEKVERLLEEKSIISFNPNSPTQIGSFFKFHDIESENSTPKGEPQWNRKELERLQKLLKIMIETEGKE